eukprot:g19905.t1
MAMGTRMGPSYACLFVEYMELSLFRSSTGTIPHLFLCYIDDCIGAVSCSHEEVKQFIHFTKTFHPNLKFTWTISDTFLSFLDISVSISSNHLETDIYFKPTDSHSYPECTSSHPPSCKNAIPYSQFLCLRRICSQDEAFHSQTSQMSSFFKDCNFPSTVVENALNRISRVSRNSGLTSPPRNNNKDRILLVLTYHPTNLRMQRIILRHFRHLQSDPITKDIFCSPSLSAVQRDHSLRDSLICSTLPTIANHFSSPFHSLDDMSILGLLQCHNDATQRLEEQHLIFRLG